MKDTKELRFKRGITMLRQQFAQQQSVIFSQVLTEEEIAAIVSAHVKSYRDRIYPPIAYPALIHRASVISGSSLSGRGRSAVIGTYNYGQARQHAQHRFLLRCTYTHAKEHPSIAGCEDRREARSEDAQGMALAW